MIGSTDCMKKLEQGNITDDCSLQVASGKGKNQEKAQQSVRDHVVEKIASEVASSDEYIQKGSLAS